MKIRQILMLMFCAGFSTLGAQQVDSLEIRIQKLMDQMTIEEKVNMIHASSSFTSGGVERLGIPELVMSDGPHGVRLEHGRDYWAGNDNVNDKGTYLPTGIALAATRNPSLGYQFGKVLGQEANARGKDIILGPGVNIMRTPLNGRNFEYLSEDPYLAARMAVGYIKGVQDQGVSACVKHYAGNNQEISRNTIDVNMSERALREIYLPAFKAAVTEGGANSIMGVYNKFRGQWACHNHYLMNQILKTEWHFNGVVVSDWGGVHNTMEAINYGTDIEMGSDIAMLPNPNYHAFFLGDTVVSLVKKGMVAQNVIDDKVERILRLMLKTNLIDGKRQPGAFATKEHQRVARKIAEEGIVLLKNENDLLPLSATKKRTIAVIGANATIENAIMGGSSQLRPLYEVTPLQGLKNIAGGKIKFVYAQGYTIAKDGKADPKMIKDAIELAKQSDEVIFVGGWTHGYKVDNSDNAFDTEGGDKPDMNLPFGQDELISALLKANSKTVLVMIGGAAFDMSTWIDRAPAIVQAWYPGMEGGNALADILFGFVNPSGKLPVTFPKKWQDSPAHKFGMYPGVNDFEFYNEGIFVGYRYFDTYKVAPQFAFGHGLSYTSFDISGLQVEKTPDSVVVRLNLKNTGKRAGAEVVQLYVSDPDCSVVRPEKELKAFQKIYLKPQETKQVSFMLGKDAFSFFSEKEMDWKLEPGRFQIKVGNASNHISLTTEVQL